MRIRHLLPALACCGVLAGCESDNPGAAAFRSAFPPPPAIGATQVDRMGRAAVATALVSPLAAPATRGADRDAYNRAPQAQWGTFRNNIRGNLAVFDGLDRNCGNQVLANRAVTTAARYDALAGALADDRLYVNAASGVCNQYLAVELDATGTVPNDDCGGRTLTYDTIDVTLTAVTNDLTLAVGDGVDNDNFAQSDLVFPFLAEHTPPPAAPAIAARQIDRMGRAAIATALISPLAPVAQRGMDRDAYNAAAPAAWVAFRDNMRGNLAVYDALDTVCGNQLLANAAVTTPSRYDPLANALVDDRLYVNGAGRTCNQYLGVELNATGRLPNSDCGGRTPLYDTIDVTLTAVTANLTVAVSDGVNSDNVAQSQTVFPFLAAP
jgi:hypothetical protein